MTEHAREGDIVREHGFPIGTEQIVRVSSEYGVSTQIPPGAMIVGGGSSKFISHGEYDVILRKEQFEFLIKVRDAIKWEEKMGR